MHGCWAGRARRYLHAIFPECLITTIRDVSDPEFLGECPDCTHPERLEKLCETVYRQRAHLGIAFDGDGDRIALVDGHGGPLSSEETAWVLLRSLGRKVRDRPFVYDLKLSDRLPEAARRLGAEPLIERSTPASLYGRMLQTGAVFGAQADGHYFFADLAGDEDALYTACCAIAYLSHSGKTLTALRRRCPPAYMTPDLRFPMPAQTQQTVVDQIRGALADFPQITLDGLRVNLPGGWALVHDSGDGAGLTFRFESFDWPSLDSVVREVCTATPSFGPQLWASYERAMGRGE
jgi:phosphomannomutase